MKEEAPRILSPEYYERLKAVEQQHPWAIAMRRLAIDLLGKHGADLDRPNVLDAGCGAGFFLAQLAETFPGAGLTGCDLSTHGLHAAQSHGLRRLAAATTVALPFPSGEFHVVICQDVLQHLTTEQARSSLREFGRVLRPGGWLLIRTAARRGMLSKKHLDTSDYRQWEPAELRSALAGPGFEVTFLARVNWLPGLLADLRALRRPRPQGDVGLGLDPNDGQALKGRVLTAYWRLERGLILGAGWRPGRGHTLFCLARKVRSDSSPILTA